jgi:D-alanyl-D-alanine carboxypeptidase
MRISQRFGVRVLSVQSTAPPGRPRTGNVATTVIIGMISLCVAAGLGVVSSASAVVPTVPPATVGAKANEVWTSRPLSATEVQRLSAKVWHQGCPVALSDIRRVTVKHWTYKGTEKTGQLDVRFDVADDVIAIFRDLYAQQFPINKMIPIEAYGGSDDKSIDDDNTSALNCRAVTGGKHFSQHSYGTAIDLNPYRNPYLIHGKTQPRPGVEKYLNRDPAAALTGVIYAKSAVVKTFADHGWKWGGSWRDPVDYQHFSLTGK